jgi:hypothetical protein
LKIDVNPRSAEKKITFFAFSFWQQGTKHCSVSACNQVSWDKD